MAVRSEQYSHQSPDSCDRHASNTSGQAEPHDIYMTVLKALLQGDQMELRAGPVKHISGTRNVQIVQQISGLDDINNSRRVFTEHAISNIERFQGKFTFARACGEAEQRPTYWQTRSLNKQGNMSKRAVTSQYTRISLRCTGRGGFPLFRIFVRMFFKAAVNVEQWLQEEEKGLHESDCKQHLSYFLFTRGKH